MAIAADQPIRWGIIGTGGIAAAFAGDLKLLPDAQLIAVGSRSQDSADKFGARFDIARRYPTYEQLVEDPDIDAVYVSTPHPWHHPNALLAIRAGKAVLVEKPFTINAKEARELVSEARARGTFLMEAMWTRHLPHIVALRDILDQGRLGTPSKITAVSDQAFTGVDAQTGILLQYEGGQHAVLFTSLETRTPNWACVNGTEARIEIEGVFYTPSRFRLVTRDGEVEQFDFPHEGHGLRHQAATVGKCLRAGLTESDALPLDESIAIMETMDEIRVQIGLVYPGES